MLGLLILLCFSSIFSTVSSKIVCRVENETEVSCPDDYFCCGVESCCKLDFHPEETDHGKTTADRYNVSSLDEWISALCVRIVMLAICMALIYFTCKTFKACKTRCTTGECGCEETQLPKYKPLDNNNIVSDMDNTNISSIMGTPLYQVNAERIWDLKSTFP